jgi:VIT1/CCC1 family predicted Fe2+/Mn2+ transporter
MERRSPNGRAAESRRHPKDATLLVPIISAVSLGFLALLGAIGAKAGGANILRETARMTFWGTVAMALTAGIGPIVGTAV